MNIPLHCLNSRWSCHVYTFINKNGPNSSYCDMCGTRKKTTQESFKANGTFDMQFGSLIASSAIKVFNQTESHKTSQTCCKFSASICSDVSQEIY